jgi:single-strand DNA-binding protein
VNNWCISGYLGHDSKMRTLPNGTLVLNFSVAVQRRVKVDGQWQSVPIWTDVTLFGTRAEWLSERLKKGSHVEAYGELGIREYEGRDGKQHTQVELLARDVNPLDKREQGEAPRTQQQRQGGQGSYQAPPAPPPASYGEDDIPF